MEKVQLSEIYKNLKFIHRGEYSSIYQMPNGDFLKLFDIDYLDFFINLGFDMERKILETTEFLTHPAIIKPSTAVYDGDCFRGFIMPSARGVNYNKWNSNLTLKQRANLLMYATNYKKLEDILKSTPNIVYPDICTCDNIYINGSSTQLIDYDGLQIANYPTVSFSTTLGDFRTYLNSTKYCQKTNTYFPLFTKELDKKSLILLYFLTTFNIDLNKVGVRDPFRRKIITLDDIFGVINLQDYDMMHKVWKIFQDNENNEWLGDDVFRIAEDYKMIVDPHPYDGKYLKKLVRR